MQLLVDVLALEQPNNVAAGADGALIKVEYVVHLDSGLASRDRYPQDAGGIVAEYQIPGLPLLISRLISWNLGKDYAECFSVYLETSCGVCIAERPGGDFLDERNLKDRGRVRVFELNGV
jgi:hypothetical protein